MAIKKPLKHNEAAATAFIDAAPDASAKNRSQQDVAVGVMRGHKRQISLTLPPDFLPRIDAAAEVMGVARAAWITMAISKELAGR